MRELWKKYEKCDFVTEETQKGGILRADEH